MPNIKPFFDPVTSTISYVVSDPTTNLCAIIDPVLDYDLESKITSTTSAQRILDYVQQANLTVAWILETHVHADHLTAAYDLQEKVGGQIGIGSNIKEALAYWAPLLKNRYAIKQDIPLDGSQFDCLFQEGDVFKLGELDVRVLHTPGHTPTCVSYCIDDCVFVGDLIFMPYLGTGRADFPGGSAETLYQSAQKILAFPDETRLFSAHDCPAEGAEAAWESTVFEQKKHNVFVNDTISQEAYIELREARDAQLALPRLFDPAIQANLCSGESVI
jgi:glyoxylase-like metal-dependent hydrolase (beta-lactamase superfamily II)